MLPSDSANTSYPPTSSPASAWRSTSRAASDRRARSRCSPGWSVSTGRRGTSGPTTSYLGSQAYRSSLIRMYLRFARVVPVKRIPPASDVTFTIVTRSPVRGLRLSFTQRWGPGGRSEHYLRGRGLHGSWRRDPSAWSRRFREAAIVSAGRDHGVRDARHFGRDGAVRVSTAIRVLRIGSNVDRHTSGESCSAASEWPRCRPTRRHTAGARCLALRSASFHEIVLTARCRDRTRST